MGVAAAGPNFNSTRAQPNVAFFAQPPLMPGRGGRAGGLLVRLLGCKCKFTVSLNKLHDAAIGEATRHLNVAAGVDLCEKGHNRRPGLQA